MKSILLFASGSGSNVSAILNYFNHDERIHFPAILTNNKNAGVIEIAKKHQINVILFDRTLFNSFKFVDILKTYNPDLLVLAGFLWKIPDAIVKHFPNKIINIHPALLPQYGGKGMYGHFVHEAVIAHHEQESGITIHYVNEHYDEGTVLLQKKVAIEPSDDAISLAQKVLQLEHAWYSNVIEQLLEL